MRFISTVALAAAMTVAASPAMAQEAAPFTGPHVEALLGYDNVALGDDGSNESIDGLGFGIGGGYDFQIGGAIVGIEGEWSDSTAKFGEDEDAYRLETDRDLYIGARVGYAIAPATMLYVKGGYTNARFETEFGPAENDDDNDDGYTADGWRIGAGVEQKFNLFGPGGFAKIEYRYSNYSNLDVNTPDGEDEIEDLSIDLDRHQVMVGLGVRF